MFTSTLTSVSSSSRIRVYTAISINLAVITIRIFVSYLQRYLQDLYSENLSDLIMRQLELLASCTANTSVEIFLFGGIAPARLQLLAVVNVDKILLARKHRIHKALVICPNLLRSFY